MKTKTIKREPKKNLNLWKISAPWLVMVLLGSITMPINTLVISHLGSKAIETVGTASGILSFFRTLITFVSGGIGIIIGKYIGKKKSKEEINSLLDSANLLVFVFSLIIGLLLIAFSKYLLMLWSVKDNTEQMRWGQKYIMLMSSGVFLFSISGIFATAITAYGFAAWQTGIGICSILFDILFSFLFVYYTDLGPLSVGLGTIISRIVAILVIIVIYHFKIKSIFKKIHPSWKIIKDILKISGPIAGEKISYNGTQFVLGIIVGVTGTHLALIVSSSNLMLTSRAIFLSIQGLVTVFSVALGIGLEVVASRMLAQNKFDEAKKLVRRAFLTALIFDLILAGTVAGVNGYIIQLMMRNDTLGIAGKIKYMLFIPFMLLIPLQIGRTLNLIYIASTRSAGDVKWTFIASVTISWLLICLASFIFAFVLKMGMTGIVLAMAMDELIRGMFNLYRWKSNKWKRYI